jgi:hypothetical protein
MEFKRNNLNIRNIIMKKFKLKTLAASFAAAGMIATGTAQADSVLAPLLVSDIVNGWVSVINLKARGQGFADNQFNNGTTALHYTYLKKSNNIAGLFNNPLGCEHDNGSGTISSWDMLTHTVDPFVDALAKSPGSDLSTPYTPLGFPFDSFAGMAVIDDVVNLDTANEGNLSGHVSVFNLIAGIQLDYRLLNNHRSTASGDFSVGFTRKSSVDLTWAPQNRELTLWLAVATGQNMTAGNSYNGTATISQNTRIGNSDPAAPHELFPNTSGGVYNNDERNLSQDVPVTVNCMGMFSVADVTNNSQQFNSIHGGWKRNSIVGGNGADGAMVYKAALKFIPSIIAGRAIISFNTETSGHLAIGNEHPNRPY